MQEDRKTIYLRLLVELAVAAVAIAFAALLGRPILGIMLPFILAFIMAWALNPVIQILQRRLRLTRKLFSYILVLMIYAVLGVLAFVFVTQMIGQLIDLVGAVPSIVAQMQKAYNALMQYILQLLDMLPPGYEEVRQEVLSLFASAWDWLRGVITRLVSGAVGITSGVAMEVPSFVIFLTVLILASCIITTDFPNLRENIYAYLGSRGKHSLRLMGHSFRTAVLGFFRSQLIFALVDMAIILVAFFIIGVTYPLPIALVLCFLDFIPFFGAGTVLVPWGLICLLLGFAPMGAQLLLLYAILYILRRIFEPRVLGGATGFSSLQMLLSMYEGMRLAGVTGLIIAPIIWIAVVNFLRTGIFDGVRADLAYVISDIGRMIARPEPTRTTEPPGAVPRSGKKPLFAFLRRPKN